jgi:hypothetical protein
MRYYRKKLVIIIDGVGAIDAVFTPGVLRAVRR